MHEGRLLEHASAPSPCEFSKKARARGGGALRCAGGARAPDERLDLLDEDLAQRLRVVERQRLDAAQRLRRQLVAHRLRRPRALADARSALPQLLREPLRLEVHDDALLSLMQDRLELERLPRGRAAQRHRQRVARAHVRRLRARAQGRAPVLSKSCMHVVLAAATQ